MPSRSEAKAIRVPSGDHAGWTSAALLSVTRSDGWRTVTVKCWLAVSPLGSRAVTVTVALPVATAVTVTMLSATATVTTAGSDHVAV